MTYSRIQLRRGTAQQWIDANPVLNLAEVGIETDTLKIKLGDGTSHWNEITNYVNIVPNGNQTAADFVPISDVGNPDGVVALDSSSNVIVPGSSIIIEGATSNTYETTLTVIDPTADRTITFPNSTGTVALTSDITTAINAIDALPAQLDNGGKFLTTNGSVASWATISLTAIADANIMNIMEAW